MKSMGKVALGWDEILRGMSRADDDSAVDSVVVQSWTGPEVCVVEVTFLLICPCFCDSFLVNPWLVRE